MRWVTVAVVLMLVAALIAPAVAGSDERYSYITVEDVTVQLVKEHAVVTVNYQIDDGIGFLVLLLGKSDLKRKVLDILNFEDAKIKRLRGQGSYWFPGWVRGNCLSPITA